MPLNRRTFLKYGLAGSAVLALGGIGLSLQSTKMREPLRALSVFSAREYSILTAIISRLLPSNGVYPDPIELEVAENIDTLMSRAHPGTAQEIKLVLRLIENAAAGLLFDGNPRPFTQCTSEKQDQILEAWRTSRLSVRRGAFKAINSLCAGTYYADPRTHRFLGYNGPPAGLLEGKE